ncbi:MAG: molecular chaperone DnaJ, partial [Sphingomonas sp.]|nr:molecular chaperone DnaJ [Sphingomonas sp.]
MEGTGRPCAVGGCEQAGEFRAPAEQGRTASDQPPPYRWLCLDHVREFNARYNFFAGMTPEEISDAQRPYAGWERETRAFATSGTDRPPAWADFADPLDAISARFRGQTAAARADGRPLSDADRRALKVLGLEINADRRALRRRYSVLVRD